MPCASPTRTLTQLKPANRASHRRPLAQAQAASARLAQAAAAHSSRAAQFTQAAAALAHKQAAAARLAQAAAPPLARSSRHRLLKPPPLRLLKLPPLTQAAANSPLSALSSSRPLAQAATPLLRGIAEPRSRPSTATHGLASPDGRSVFTIARSERERASNILHVHAAHVNCV